MKYVYVCAAKTTFQSVFTDHGYKAIGFKQFTMNGSDKDLLSAAFNNS